MSKTPANDNPAQTHKSRPDGFDALLVSHIPAIRRRVRRLSQVGHEEIASDAIELAMRYAHTFDPARAGFYAWLMLQVRSAARDYRVRTRKVWDHETVLDDDNKSYTPASQIDAVMLGEVLSAANDNKGQAAVMVGMGYTMKELGEMTGFNPVYANTVARAGRAALRDFAGMGPIKRRAA